jgi:DNA-binding NtrC family response regulator
LSERREAIVPLAEYFLARAAVAIGSRPNRLSDAARSALVRYAWPGNIRELKNVIERAVILAHGEIDASHLGLEAGSPFPPPEGLLAAGEREVIRNALSQNGGNRKETARILGISLRTLQYRIKEHGL